MGLFSPWFLAGLLALGLPIWLHLLRQFKRTPQPFSSLMFFERQIQSSSKHRRLRYLTLLLLRLLLLAMLALLFANPFINRASTAVTPKGLTIVAIDRSFSMRYKDHLAEAKAQAIQFVKAATANEPLQLLGVDSHALPLTQVVLDRSDVVDAIKAVEQTDDVSSYGELTRALKVMEQTTRLALNVHLFTDAQQSSMPAAFSDLQQGPHTSLTIHEIGSGPAANWAVQSVSAPSRIYDSASIRLVAGVSGWQTPEASRKISILLDGHNIASKGIIVPASGKADIEFDNLTIPYGAHQGEVELTPHDDLPNDDRFLFSIERSDPRKVLFISSQGRNTDGFFYKAALDASKSSGLRVQSEPVSQVTRIDLSSYAAVVLNNPDELDNSTSQALSDYVSKGGSALIAVGPATVRSGVTPLSGDRVAGTIHSQMATAKSSGIFSSDVFENVQFFSTPKITPQPGERVIANFSDGSPLLLEQTKGEGKLLTFAASLDDLNSDFAIHSGFVPFVAATGDYMAGGNSDASSVIVGSAVTLRQSKSQSAAADVIGPDGKHEFPLSDGTRIMSFNPEREGFYDVHSANGRRRLVAVNADRRESNLERVTPETLILWRNTSNSGAAAAGTEVENKVVQFSLWRYILIFVLIAAIVESIFATRYLSEERQAA